MLVTRPAITLRPNIAPSRELVLDALIPNARTFIEAWDKPALDALQSQGVDHVGGPI
jgi:hypothetical protein